MTPRVRKRKAARYQALDAITNLISHAMPTGGNGVSFEYLNNKFASEESKKLFIEEVNKIEWQLFNRRLKIQEELFAQSDATN